MSELQSMINDARLAQLRYERRIPVQLEIGEQMRRYVCVFMYSGTCEVEFYWADNHDHAKEQCMNANPPDIEYLGTFRDSQDDRVLGYD